VQRNTGLRRRNKEAGVLVKKYGNRRLYDTDESRYITLEELAQSVRQGKDVRVVDAKTGADLTTATLAQIIIEGRGAGRLLPPALLVQLIRMGDDALAEFLGQYVTWALDVYLQTKQGVQAMAPFNPFYGVPRGFGMGAPAAWPSAPPAPRQAQPPPSAPADDVAALRRELEDLKKTLKKKPGR
jgi:polyhydroxyalkanoate synthesis repressor PhaR